MHAHTHTCHTSADARKLTRRFGFTRTCVRTCTRTHSRVTRTHAHIRERSVAILAQARRLPPLCYGLSVSDVTVRFNGATRVQGIFKEEQPGKASAIIRTVGYDTSADYKQRAVAASLASQRILGDRLR